MPYIGSRGDAGDTSELATAMVKCGIGKPAHLVAQAALDTCLIIWKVGGVTLEQALTVLEAQARAVFAERSN